MPEISRFLGIIIYMYYKDHSPPHFHAEYNEYSITVEIDTGVVEGRFPKRALSAVLEWLDIHKNEIPYYRSQIHQKLYYLVKIQRWT